MKMILKKGITLVNLLSQKKEAISINSGICHANAENIPEVNFNDVKFTPIFQLGAVLPKSDWQRLTPKELKTLKSDKNVSDSKTIFLGDLPNSLVQKFKNIPLLNSKKVEDIYDTFRIHQDLAKELNEDLNIFLNSISDNKPFDFRCFGVSFPNLLSVSGVFTHLSKNHKPTDVKYFGIHNDCSEEMSIYTTHKYGNRISINFGSQSRDFLFVNLSIIQAFNMIKKKDPNLLSDISLVNIPNKFFSLFPDYPIIKVKLKPYQYYIAPTNNCFHDGSTLGNNSLDMTMIFFGKFLISQKLKL